ncbi:hypothetical protein CCM_02810 [Cordyceps militaris CM01]|uniref:Uncharacterized protein n=1 Tax=Cordyceps militaris (strain CM01) TaxID=983644 RepID=G3JBW6_CORMM|nr:uncharacterized protein CCM_02810 [Cordyceps militaris CM01]EGX94539.1 hypothetical protein CCM_02810 [Cordyceps militaris CM01]
MASITSNPQEPSSSPHSLYIALDFSLLFPLPVCPRASSASSPRRTLPPETPLTHMPKYHRHPLTTTTTSNKTKHQQTTNSPEKERPRPNSSPTGFAPRDVPMILVPDSPWPSNVVG